MQKEILKKYARLLVKTGVNIQPGQTLVINAPVEDAEFVRIVAETAYKEGARDVAVSWNDEILAKTRYMLAPDEVFDEFPDWKKILPIICRKGAFLSISASNLSDEDVDQSGFQGPTRQTQWGLTNTETLMSNENSWCVASIPTDAWARRYSRNHLRKKPWEGCGKPF